MSNPKDTIPANVVFNDLMDGFAEAIQWAKDEKELPVTVLEVSDSTSQEVSAQAVREYAVLYAYSEEGWEATVPDLPGCETVGDTLEEAKALIRVFIQMHLEDLHKAGKPISEPRTHAEQVRVAA